MTEKITLPFCYLCGTPLNGEVNDDHVPPKQFFPESTRQLQDLKLLKLPTHQICNKAYQLDEDYFLTSIGPLAMGSSLAGRELWKDIFKRLKRPKGAGLTALIRSEYHLHQGDIVFPNGEVAKKFDLKRIRRVIWKIVRGLFAYETNRFLPSGTPQSFKFQSLVGKGTPPEEFFELAGTPIKGNHKGIFAYRYLKDSDLLGFNIWSMLLWDAWIVVICFHDPDCPCDICLKSKT